MYIISASLQNKSYDDKKKREWAQIPQIQIFTYIYYIQ